MIKYFGVCFTLSVIKLLLTSTETLYWNNKVVCLMCPSCCVFQCSWSCVTAAIENDNHSDCSFCIQQKENQSFTETMHYIS